MLALASLAPINKSNTLQCNSSLPCEPQSSTQITQPKTSNVGRRHTERVFSELFVEYSAKKHGGSTNRFRSSSTWAIFSLARFNRFISLCLVNPDPGWRGAAVATHLFPELAYAQSCRNISPHALNVVKLCEQLSRSTMLPSSKHAFTRRSRPMSARIKRTLNGEDFRV